MPARRCRAGRPVPPQRRTVHHDGWRQPPGVAPDGVLDGSMRGRARRADPVAFDGRSDTGVDQQPGHGGQGRAPPAAPPIAAPPGQPGERAGGQQVAGGMVEGLNGQRRRSVARGCDHAGMGDARAHLHEAVESAPAGPRPGPPVGIEADVDQAGPGSPTGGEAEPQPLQGTRTVAVDQYVGGVQEPEEPLTSAVGGQVQEGAALPDRHLGDDSGLVPPRRVDAQDLGPPSGQQAGGHRAGQDPGQVEHPHAGQRTGRVDLRAFDLPGALDLLDRRGPLDMDQGFAGHRGALGVGVPFVHRAQRRSDSAGLDHGRLEVPDLPPGHRFGHSAPLARRAEDGQGGSPVVGSVGVEPDPAVVSGVVAGHCVPRCRHLPPVRPERPGEPGGCQVTVDSDGRFGSTTGGNEAGQCRPGRADRSLGQVADREGRGEGPARGKLDPRPDTRHPESVEELVQECARRVGHRSIVDSNGRCVNRHG